MHGPDPSHLTPQVLRHEGLNRGDLHSSLQGKGIPTINCNWWGSILGPQLQAIFHGQQLLNLLESLFVVPCAYGNTAFEPGPADDL